jgi:hypothetical protein
MPSFVPPEPATFAVEEGKAVVRASGVRVHQPSDWSLLSQPTLVVVDGPGDEGFLFARIDPAGNDHAPVGWDDAVQRHAWAWLVVDDDTTVFASLIGPSDA